MQEPITEQQDQTSAKPTDQSESHGAAAKDSSTAGKSALDSLGILVTKTLARPITIFISIATAVFLGPEDKGLAAWISLLVLASTNIFSFGCGTSVKYFVSKGELRLREHVSTMILIGLLNGLIGSLCLAVLFETNSLGKVTASLPQVWKYCVLGVVPLMTIRLVLFRALMGDSKFKIVNRLELTNGMFYSMLLVFLVILGGWGLIGAATAFLVTQALFSVIALIIVLRKYPLQLSLGISLLWQTYAYGMRSWIGTLSKRLNVSFDSLIVGVVSTANVLGNYSVAATIARSLVIIPTSINPVLSNRMVRQSERQATATVMRIHRLMFVTMLVLSTVLALSAGILLPLIMPAYSDVPLILLLLLIGTVFTGCFSVLGSYFISQGKPGRPSIAQIIAFVVGGVITPLLTVQLGGIGAAIASTLTYITTWVVQITFLMRRQDTDFVRLWALNRDDVSWVNRQVEGVRQRLSSRRRSRGGEHA